MSLRSRTFILCAIILLSALYVSACHKAGAWLIKNDSPAHADVIILLKGSVSDRVLHTVDMYQKGVANRLLLVESGASAYGELKERGANIISGTELICNAAIDLGISDKNIIILPGNAQSTQQEAMIIREYLSDESGIDTLLLVTSSQHTRRALMIFKRAFWKSESRVYILCSPSSYTDFDAEKWWKSKDSIEEVLLEYIKIANFLIIDRRKLKKE